MKSKFLNNFEDCIEISNNTVDLNTNFRELEEWDSLALLNLMAMLEDEYGVQISRKQLDELITLEDIYKLTI